MYYSSRELEDAFLIGVRVTKFDLDLNPVAFYVVTEKACTCPAGGDRACKHRNRFQTFLRIANSGKFWDDKLKRVVTLEEMQCE